MILIAGVLVGSLVVTWLVFAFWRRAIGDAAARGRRRAAPVAARGHLARSRAPPKASTWPPGLADATARRRRRFNSSKNTSSGTLSLRIGAGRARSRLAGQVGRRSPHRDVCGTARVGSRVFRRGELLRARRANRGRRHAAARARCIEPAGLFCDARFELDEPGVVKHFDEHSWAWNDNPFVGTRELNGLKIVMMLLSNWDNKDVRDVARGSNTAIFEYRMAPRCARGALSDYRLGRGSRNLGQQRAQPRPLGLRGVCRTERAVHSRRRRRPRAVGLQRTAHGRRSRRISAAAMCSGFTSIWQRSATSSSRPA